MFFMETLTESQIPTFLSSIDNITSQPVAPIANPNVVTKKRGRPSAPSHNKRRNKSAFEYVEGPKCTSCGNPGHNSRTCGNLFLDFKEDSNGNNVKKYIYLL